mgnify:CR=1 FL=1
MKYKNTEVQGGNTVPPALAAALRRRRLGLRLARVSFSNVAPAARRAKTTQLTKVKTGKIRVTAMIVIFHARGLFVPRECKHRRKAK